MEQNQIFLPVEYSLLKTFTRCCRDYGIMENQIDFTEYASPTKGSCLCMDLVLTQWAARTLLNKNCYQMHLSHTG